MVYFSSSKKREKPLCFFKIFKMSRRREKARLWSIFQVQKKGKRGKAIAFGFFKIFQMSRWREKARLWSIFQVQKKGKRGKAIAFVFFQVFHIVEINRKTSF